MSSKLADSVAALREAANNYWTAIERQSAHIVDVEMPEEKGSVANPTPPTGASSYGDTSVGKGAVDATPNHNISDEVHEPHSERVSPEPARPSKEAADEVKKEEASVYSPTPEAQPPADGHGIHTGMTDNVESDPLIETVEEDVWPTCNEKPAPPPLDALPKERALTVHRTGLIATLRRKLRSLFGDV